MRSAGKLSVTVAPGRFTRTVRRRTGLTLTLVVATLAATLTPATGAQAASCPAPRTSAVYASPGSGKTVALTFDDGPGPETTKVLAILKRYNVRATFFVVGRNVSTNPAVLRRVAADGHLVANHSYSHVSFATLSHAQQVRQLDAASDVIAATVRTRPCWFRPPYGAMSSSTVSAARSQGLSTALWNVDTRDWAASTRLNSTDYLAIRARARAGTRLTHPMVLFHDGGASRPNMLHELPGIITWYRNHGYRFVGLDGQEMRHSSTCDFFGRRLTTVQNAPCR